MHLLSLLALSQAPEHNGEVVFHADECVRMRFAKRLLRQLNRLPIYWLRFLWQEKLFQHCGEDDLQILDHLRPSESVRLLPRTVDTPYISLCFRVSEREIRPPAVATPS